MTQPVVQLDQLLSNGSGAFQDPVDQELWVSIANSMLDDKSVGNWDGPKQSDMQVVKA